MATPTIPERRLMAAGLKKSGQSWGTAEALGAGFGVLLESDGGLNRTQPYLPAMEADSPMVLEGDLGPIDPVVFAPEFTMRYDPGALGIAIALLFGTAGAPDNKGSGAYRHTFQWADENYGNFVTFALEKAAKILEVASAKPMSLDLSVADGLIKGSIGFIGNTLIDSSAVNTLTQMDALTYKDRGNRMKFTEAEVKMNSQIAGAVQSETALEVSDISIHYERPQDNPHKAGSAAIIEPAENAHPIITVDLNFPRMNTVNAAFFATDFIAELEQKMEIRITGTLIGATFYRYIYLVFPRLRVIETEYTWDEVIPARIKLQAEEAAAAPTGFSYARPHAYLENTRSTDYLA